MSLASCMRRLHGETGDWPRTLVQITGMLTSRGEEIHLGMPLTFLHHCMGVVSHATGPVACPSRSGLFLLRLRILALHVRGFPSAQASSDAEIQDFSR